MIKILIPDKSGADCYAFGNADGKQWVMPCHNMRMAMNLYQPSSRTGRMVKKLFPIPLLQPLIARRIPAQRQRLRLRDDLLSIFHSLWGAGNIEFSLFGGTPGRHRKTIIQLSRGNDILGYCKVTENPEIAALFDKETATLRQLHQQGLDCVPKALYRDKTADGLEIFIQSTVKTRKSKICHSWTPMHDEFLTKMAELTASQQLFEETDYYKTITDLKRNIELFPYEDDRSFILTKIDDIIKKYSGKKVTCSAYHGDFTPWNTFADENTLYVFDWEYGKLTYPVGLDKCHFLIQTAIFEKHLEAPEIRKIIANLPHENVEMYLLDVISRYSIREKGKPSVDAMHSFRIWSSTLKIIDKKYV